jgi:hypothetical protein
MLIHPFVKGASFDPEHVKAMGGAFDGVIRQLDDMGQSSIAREVIAEQIIALAKSGERDPDKLCELAMDALGVRRLAAHSEERLMTLRERNRVWTSEDIRVLRSALGTTGNVRAAAKYLDRDPTEVEGMAADLGWIDSPPLAPGKSV